MPHHAMADSRCAAAMLVCCACGREYPTNKPYWCCPCGGLLDLSFQPSFDLDAVRQRAPDLWRYREALPIDHDESIVSFQEGFTPLTDVTFEGRSVLIKQDHLFPTGSYKDRGATILISKARELGVSRVVEDSSGNAGCAVAAYSAAAGIGCDIYVPADSSAAKLSQIRLYGARVQPVAGSRADTARAALAAAAGHYYASHSWNPYFLHGTKTFAFEVCEQLGWKPPDTVIFPVGNGTLLLGAALGFRELLKAGVIDSTPRFVAVQAAGCAPLHRVLKEDLSTIPDMQSTKTMAEGIAIARPIRGQQIIETIRASQGDIIVVEDAEIKASLYQMGGKGFCIEPTSAATTAGVTKYVQQRRDTAELIVAPITGHGLKSPEKMVRL